MNRDQEVFWRKFWIGSGSIEVDQKSLQRKLSKQGGLILKNLNLDGKSILDIGCGFAFIDRYLVEQAGCTVTGLDFQAHHVHGASNEDRVRFVSADTLALPFVEELFDMVLAVEMLHHLKRAERDTAINQMCRVLKRGGHLSLIEVNRFHPLILALTLFDRSERNQFTLSVRHLTSLLRTRFANVELYPLNYFLPSYKYQPPPLVEKLRRSVYFLEDLTEKRYLCTEYLILARDFQPEESSVAAVGT